MSNRNTLSVKYDVQDYFGINEVTGGEMWSYRTEFSDFATISEARKGARELRRRVGKGARTRIVRKSREVVEVSK